MSWIQLNVSVTNGSNVVAVNNNLSTAKVRVGDALILAGFQPVEIVGVYANSLTIASNWENSAQNGAMAAVMPTFGDFDNAAATMRQFTQITQGNFAAMEAWWTQQSGTVTFKGQDGAEHQVRSAKQMDQDVQEKTDAVQAVTDEMVSLVGAQVALTQPDVYIPFNDSLQIVRGYGTHDKIDVSQAQDGSVMVELPTKSVDFSRASGRTRLTRSGQIEAIGINYPSITKDGISVFSSYTNEHRNSEDFTQPYWSKEGTLLVGEGVLAPDGISMAQSLTISTTNAFQSLRLIGSPSLTGETWCSSVFCKAGTISKFRIIANAAGSVEGVSNASAEFDLANGTAINVSGCRAVGIIECADGWFWCYSVYTKDADGNQLKLVDLSSSGAGIGDYIYAWGAQLTKSKGLMPYVQTQSSSVAVSSDLINLDIKDNLPVPGKPFSICMDVNIEMGATAFWLGIAGSLGIYLERYSANGKLRVVANQGHSVLGSDDNYKLGKKVRCIYSFGGNNNTASLFIDGNEVASSATNIMPNYLDENFRFQIGSRNNASQVNGPISEFKIYDFAITPALAKVMGEPK